MQVVTDAATELSGAAFGSFFYNVVDDKGESYTLYTISGRAARGVRAISRCRATPRCSGRPSAAKASCAPTTSPRIRATARTRRTTACRRAICRCAAISRCRSCRASGEVLGGLFFGHPEPGVFTERAERIVAAIAVQAGIAIDKARLYRAAQDEIERRKRVESAAARERADARTRRRGSPSAAANAQLSGGRQREAEGRFRHPGRGRRRLRHLHAGPAGHHDQLEHRRRAHQGLSPQRDRRPAFSRFYTDEDRAAGLPAEGARDRGARGQVRGGGLARAQGRHALLGERRARCRSATSTAS